MRLLSTQAKPTATISAPTRLSGRCHQANSPVPMNDQVMTSAITAKATPPSEDVPGEQQRDAAGSAGEHAGRPARSRAAIQPRRLRSGASRARAGGPRRRRSPEQLLDQTGGR